MPGSMRGSSVDFGCTHKYSPQAGPPLPAVAVFLPFWFESAAVSDISLHRQLACTSCVME
jgi:hypothetical protein